MVDVDLIDMELKEVGITAYRKFVGLKKCGITFVAVMIWKL